MDDSDKKKLFVDALHRAWALILRSRDAPNSAISLTLEKLLAEASSPQRSIESLEGYLKTANELLSERPLRTLLLDPGPRGLIVQGLITSIPLGIIAAQAWNYWLREILIAQGFDAALLAGAASFGALGSWVSLASRLDRLDVVAELSTERPFVTGLTRPLIGSAFGVLMVLAYHAKLAFSLAEQLQPIQKAALFYAAAFLCGFSERFQADAVSRIRGELLPKKPQQPMLTEGPKEV